MNIASGTRLGQYEIRSKIGAGGMGEVYRAYDPRMHREVAIKVLPAALSIDKDRLARFEQEAQAAGALNHPNILVIHHIDTHDGAPYIVSELLEGETLRERMGGVALSQRKAIDYALQITHGLAAAHEKGIVHRDLKPDNIFMTKEGRVKSSILGREPLSGKNSEARFHSARDLAFALEALSGSNAASAETMVMPPLAPRWIKRRLWVRQLDSLNAQPLPEADEWAPG